MVEWKNPRGENANKMVECKITRKLRAIELHPSCGSEMENWDCCLNWQSSFPSHTRGASTEDGNIVSYEGRLDFLDAKYGAEFPV